ncbi:hypothetical protein ACLOJK_013561 [Asimina triloba]
MFTDGLDPNSVRWVREGPQGNPIHSFQNGGRNFGLPPTSKFRSGHLATSAIPISRPIPADDSGFGSDMEESTESEEEVYGGRYSLDSSPQDDMERRVPNGMGHRFVNSSRRQQQYASDSMYSDFSSSRETVQRQQVHVNGRTGAGAGRYPIGKSDYSEEEMSDSGGSSEFVSHVRNKSGHMPSRGSYPAESYSSNVPGWTDARPTIEKDPRGRGMPSNINADVPSAPPIHGNPQEIRQDSCETQDARPWTAETRDSSTQNEQSDLRGIPSRAGPRDNMASRPPHQSVRTAAGVEGAAPSSSLPVRIPTFHACGQGPWYAVIAYDACVRLCLYSWAKGCAEAPFFLKNECALLRDAFGLQQVLLQSEEELLAKRSSELVSEAAAPKPKKTIGKMKVQVRKVKMSPDMPPGCSFSSLKPPVVKLESFRYRLSNMQSACSSGCEALRHVRVVPRLPPNSSFSQHSLAYVHASTQYIKQVSGLLKVGATALRNSSSYEAVQETYSCMLKMKSSIEEDAVKMQPGSGETHVFFPDSLGDDLIVEVHDSKGKYYGRVLAQVATIAEDPVSTAECRQGDKLRWWSIYREPEHELVGRAQLYINYTTSPEENGSLKSEVTMFVRYLSYVMDVATPTADCLTLVYDLLSPVILKRSGKSTLSHQENRILGDIEEQIEQILALVFENYKALDESSASGLMDVFRPATGTPAPALAPAIRLYNLLHDILSPEAQLKFCSYFQAAAKKRSRRHMVETDEFVTNSTEGTVTDALSLTTAYQKMRALCLNIRNEVFTDIGIHNKHVLPSFIDLPNISASIYSAELCNRLRAFLVACPPTSPSQPVADLVIATSDFQRDLDNWNISPVKGGVDAKELFHLYIILWIQDKRLSLLESCKLDKVKWSGVRTQHSTTPFVDEMYDRLRDTLNEYDVIICRWPEYTFVLENAVADIEKAVVEALDKQYADVLAPLKDAMTPKKFGLKYVQKIAKRTSEPYVVPEELGILLNSMKRLLDVLRPRIEMQLKSWGSCIPDGGTSGSGERLSEVTVMLRAKFRNYLQAVVEKLSENTRVQNATKLKKIIQDSKETAIESDVRNRMQPLKDQLLKTINHLHTVFESHVFVAICRGFWDRMGQILDDTFASQMQQLLGNALQEKDLEPPRSIMEVSTGKGTAILKKAHLSDSSANLL